MPKQASGQSVPSPAFNLPQTSFPAGATGLLNGTIADGASQIVVTLNKIGWPYTGGLAVTFSIECSIDGGASYAPIMGAGFPDWPTSSGGGPVDPNVTSMTCSIPAGTGRLARLSWTFAKALTVSGSLTTN